MPTTTPAERTARQRQPYSEQFRELGPAEQQMELSNLRKLYDQDRMSIRQIAKLKHSSYGFMQARLVEARQQETPDAQGSTVASSTS